MNRTLCFAVSFVLLLGGARQARADFMTLSFPGANDTFAQGVSGGSVVGRYYAGSPLSVVHGFLYNGSTYATVDFPGAPYTFVQSISGSTVGGYYYDGAHYHGFLYDGSTYTTVDPPGARETFLYNVSGGKAAGYFTDASGDHGFVYNGSTFTTLDPPGAINTVANAVSGNNVVGSYFDGNTDRAFLYDGSAFTTLDGPGGFGSEANSVSGNTVVGDYLDTFDNNHGFLYDGSTFTTLDVPGAVATIPRSIDGSSPSRPNRKRGTGPSRLSVAGTYYDVNNAAHAFLYDGSTFTTIDGPGASDTYANSVSGDTVVGSYFDPVSGSNYGYLFSPSPSAVPEPGSLALLGVAAAGLMGCAWRRTRRTISLL